MNNYDQAASAKWANAWLCIIGVHLLFISLHITYVAERLRGIESAIREARIEVRVQGGEVTP